MPARGGDCQGELLGGSGSGEVAETRLVTAGTTGKVSQERGVSPSRRQWVEDAPGNLRIDTIGLKEGPVGRMPQSGAAFFGTGAAAVYDV